MSLDTLPMELKLMIIEGIDDIIDKNCLRLSCRGFYHYMEKPNRFYPPYDLSDASSTSSSPSYSLSSLSSPSSLASSLSSSSSSLSSSASSSEDEDISSMTIRRKQDKLAFLDRLFRPGNIYHGSFKGICANCSHVCCKSKFENSNLQMNDRAVCLRCTLSLLSINLPRGASLTHCGKKYIMCMHCYDPIPVARDDNRPSSKVCSQCMPRRPL